MAQEAGDDAGEGLRPRIALRQILAKGEEAASLVAGNAAAAAALTEIVALARRGIAFRRPQRDEAGE